MTVICIKICTQTGPYGRVPQNQILCFSFNKLLLQKEELEQRHLHLLQVVESEKTAKWQYTQQCEELTSEIKKLRAEVSFLLECRNERMKLAWPLAEPCHATRREGFTASFQRSSKQDV